MRIIVLGSNYLSNAIVKALVELEHEVTVVSENAVNLKQLEYQLDIKTIVGKASYPDVLHKAHAANCDLIIAATSSDELNMLACQIAYSLFAIKNKIARIEAVNYFINPDLFGNHHLPIDTIINPNVLIARYVINNVFVDSTAFSQVINSVNLRVLTIKVSKELEFSYLQLSQDYNVSIALVKRQGELIAQADAYGQIQLKDEICVVGHLHNVNAVAASLIKEAVNNKVIVAGCNAVTACLVKSLQANYDVTVIDPDLGKCEQFAQFNSAVKVLHGVASDAKLLEQEVIADVDVFCALTGDDEDNILMAMQAKYLGANSAVALVEKDSYLPVLNTAELDLVVLPKEVVFSAMLPHFSGIKLTDIIFLNWGKAVIMAMPAKSITAKVKKLLENMLIGYVADELFVATVNPVDVTITDFMIFCILDLEVVDKLQKLL